MKLNIFSMPRNADVIVQRPSVSSFCRLVIFEKLMIRCQIQLKS